MFGAILKTIDNSFQKGMKFRRSICEESYDATGIHI